MGDILHARCKSLNSRYNSSLSRDTLGNDILDDLKRASCASENYNFSHFYSYNYTTKSFVPKRFSFIFKIWKDERIQWDKDNYNGLEVVRLPALKLWLPDIVLYNK